MSEKQEKTTANVYDIIDRLATQQENQGKQLELLAKAVAAISDRIGAQPQQGAGGDIIKLLAGLLGGGEKQVNIKQFTETAAYFARLADVLGHYRNPTLPYSPADRFLMKEGARRSYELTYHGVKSSEQGASRETPSDEQLDKMLGFVSEEKEEKKEKKEGHAV